MESSKEISNWTYNVRRVFSSLNKLAPKEVMRLSGRYLSKDAKKRLINNYSAKAK